MRLIDENKVPAKKLKSREWLELLRKIPVGKAWVIDPDADRINPSNAKAMVNLLIRTGRIGRNYQVISRTEGGVLTVYIVNSAREA